MSATVPNARPYNSADARADARADSPADGPPVVVTHDPVAGPCTCVQKESMHSCLHTDVCGTSVCTRVCAHMTMCMSKHGYTCCEQFVPSTAGTAEPTLLPTLRPTIAPSIVPSLFPSLEPSMHPTFSPTAPQVCVLSNVLSNLPFHAHRIFH